MDLRSFGKFMDNLRNNEDDVQDFINTDRGDITSVVNGAYKTIDTLAAYAREKMDSVIEMLSNASPDEMCDFNTKNGIFMLRLMHLNEKEKEITLQALGVDAMANGNSKTITAAAQSPSYAKNMNYKDNFVKEVHNNNSSETTRKYNSGTAPYGDVTNLYPADNGNGQFEKWESKNPNSILYKTKKLFEQNKINTLISRFHTDPNTPTDDLDSKTTAYGLSRGRNLLLAKAEKGVGNDKDYDVNGYNNPYCRSWTHHHQYDKINKLIRPFQDKEGTIKLIDFHSWENFKITENDAYYKNGYILKKTNANGTPAPDTELFKDEWGWKDNNDAWTESVLNNNGFLNITPKFKEGGNSNTHTKQCMFSIENLAWRDYNPYSFERALSWEQRGPMGGRIMWFPPYGLQFNETTTAQWQANTFIGRGEDVYTYTNTVRTGTLNFMMVVDHPSILDYVSWGGRNQSGEDGTKVVDTDVHRFFAGCDSVAADNNKDGSDKKLSDYAVPTPLTDEYVEVREEIEMKGVKKETEEKEVIPDNPPIDIVFYVFFPNNYSGFYDKPGSEVEAIPYLLYGQGAQMTKEGKLTKNLPLNFNDITGNEGGGYEMKDPIGKNTDNYVVGTDKRWWNVTDVNSPYAPSKKYWYYRIDGEYKNEIIDKKGKKTTPNAYINTYDQTLAKASSYVDSNCNNLNTFLTSGVFDTNEVENQYVLSDIAIALCKNEKIVGKIKNNCYIANNALIDEETIIKLKELFEGKNGYTLTKIVASGYSNSHGANTSADINEKRNDELAKNRAQTVLDWLTSIRTDWKDKVSVGEILSSQKVSGDENSLEAKKYRSAKVTMSFTSEKTENLSEADQKVKIDRIDIKKFIAEVQEELNRTYVYYTEQTANENKDNKIIEIIDKIASKYNYTQSIKDILHKCKDDISNETTVVHLTFAATKKDEIKEAIKNQGSSQILNPFKNEEDFENTLGIEIRNTIENFSLVKDKVKEFKNRYKDYNSKIDNNTKVDEAISALEEKINTIEKTTIPSLEKEYNEFIKEKDLLQRDSDYYYNLMKTHQQVIDDNKNNDQHKQEVEDAFYEIKKITKKIDELKKQITDYEKKITNKSNEIKSSKEEITKIKKQIETLNGKIQTTDDTVGSDYDEIKVYRSETYDPITTEEIKSGVDPSYKVYENNFDAVRTKVKKYLKKETDVEKHYMDRAVDEFTKELLEFTDIYVRYDDTEVIVDIDFKYNPYDTFNKIMAEYTDDKDKQFSIDKNTLKHILEEVTFSIACGEEFAQVFDSTLLLPEMPPRSAMILVTSQIKFSEEWIDKLYENLNSEHNKVEENIDWVSFFNMLDEALKEHIWIYRSGEIDGEILDDYENVIGGELEKIQKGLDASDYIGFSKHIDKSTKEIYYINENETDPVKRQQRWVLVDGKFVWKDINDEAQGRANKWDTNSVLEGTVNSNKRRYDQEYHFFRVLAENDRMTYEKLMNKIQYFNPAYHSMTPEGFSARLTFLQQCMRQGNTKTASDYNAASANNLAFGRPPYCVLRLGDFYNQMIVIDNISISYDPLVWDLNSEGVGVIPLLANVSMSFKFIGGGSMYGAVSRLQNAMSFNYYANTNLYDNRADRPRYKWSEKTNGALDGGHDLIAKDSYFHSVVNYKPL